MKNSHKLSFFLLFFFSLGTLIAQQEFNEKGQRKSVVIVKFSNAQETVLDKALTNSKKSGEMSFSKKEGYVKIGIEDIDKCSKKLKVTTMKRVFRHSGKFEEKHRKHGLHLWYEIEYSDQSEVDKAIRLFKSANQIETAHARYKIEYADGYSNTSQTIKSSTNKLQSKNSTTSNFIQAPNDPEYSKQWHYNNTGQGNGTPGSDIKLEKAWEIEKGDDRVIVAIMDESVQVDHPDLKGNMWVNENEIPGNGIDDDNNGYIDDIHGYNFSQDTGTIIGKKHGTHVAGIVAAETNNGIGVAGIAGGTGNGDGVRIMSCSILSPRGGLEESYVYAADHGAVISQNSWALSSYPYSNQADITATKAGIDYFIANAGGPTEAMNGGLVVFAMGNNGFEYNDSYPDYYDAVFHVGATNHKDQKSSFSNFGTWGEIFAPGGAGRTTDPKESRIMSTIHKSDYGYLTGTSMAAPHVSGVAALIVSHHYGNITPYQLKALIQGGADSIDHLNPGYADKLGAGRINAFTSLSAKLENIPVHITMESRTETSIQIKWNSVASADSYELRYKVTGAADWITISNINTNFYQVQGLIKGNEYHFQVRSKNASETSLYSERKIFWSDINNPKIPEKVRVSERRRNEAKLNWDAITNTSGYEVTYKKSDEQEWISFTPKGTQRAHVRGLIEGSSYEIKVRAVYGDIISEYSPVITFITGASICSDFEPWDPSKIYPSTSFWDQGSLVAHNGYIYENSYWTQNEEPGEAGAWKELEACSDGGNLFPIVSITNPTDGQVIKQESLSAIILSANASDQDGTIEAIQFEVNENLLSSGNNVSWLPSDFGSYTIKVTVTDNEGDSATDQIQVTVQEISDNLTPMVSITNPADGQVIDQEVLTAITLSADASDPDGTIANIQFEVNGALLTQGNNIGWTPSAFGDYTIKVTVTDDKGAIATSQVAITIKETITDGDCNGIPSWDPTTIYPSEGGVLVSHNNSIYQNKWWTQNNEPDTGDLWGPWKFIEPCPSSSLQKNAYKENFIISPNPATEILNILIDQKNIDFIHVNLYNLSGQQLPLKANKVLNNSKYQKSYDVSKLPKGLYMVKIEIKNRIFSKKLIIK